MRITPMLVALLVTAALAACAEPTDTADETAEITPTDATVAATPSPADTPDPTPAETVEPTATSPFDDTERCENPELGYAVEYPNDWWANERIEPDADELTPISACQYFALEPIDLQPNAGFPPGLAIWFERGTEVAAPTDGVISEDETTVDGHTARIWEFEPAAQPGFIEPGSRIYLYLIDLSDDQLAARASDIHQPTDAYEESREVLDGMMETIEIDR